MENANLSKDLFSSKIRGISSQLTFLYDTGAQISCLSTRTFRQIPIEYRPRKLNIHLNASGANGGRLKILGCYMLDVTILGKRIQHPFFVCDLKKNQAILGVDIIRRLGLCFDAVSNVPYFSNPPPVAKAARLAKEVYLPPRSGTLCPINTLDDDQQILSISVAGAPQVFPSESLIQPTNKKASVYLVNTSEVPQRIPRGTQVGNLESVKDEELLPWNKNEKLCVDQTTPLGSNSGLKRRTPVLNHERKSLILKLANLQHLEPAVREKYLKLLYDYHDVLSLSEFEYGVCTRGSHRIPLIDENAPIYQKQFPLSFEHQQEVLRQVREWLAIGVIRPCESETNNPIFCVKKHGPPGAPVKWRVVIDSRKLNLNTKVSNYRLPEISECLNRVGQKRPKFFSKIDLRSGFLQVPIVPEDQAKTAFHVINHGQFCFKVAAFGLQSMPCSFQRIMARIFNKQIAAGDIECYLDDVLAYATTENDMFRILTEAFQNLRESGMLVNLAKCNFHVKKITYLGFEITPEGYSICTDKIKAITNVILPQNLRSLRSYIGKLQFYRGSIKSFSQLIKPLTRLTSKAAGWVGGSLPADAVAAFRKTQEIMRTKRFLHYPDFNLRMHLFTDASPSTIGEKDGGLSASLVQYPNDDETQPPRAIGFVSRSLQPYEKNYSSYLCETAAIVFGVEKFEKYHFKPFTAHCDNSPVCNAFNKSIHRRTLQRMKEILAEYTFDLKYFKGADIPTDFHSRHVCQDLGEEVKISSIDLLKQINDSSLFEKNNFETSPVSKECAKASTQVHTAPVGWPAESSPKPIVAHAKNVVAGAPTDPTAAQPSFAAVVATPLIPSKRLGLLAVTKALCVNTVRALNFNTKSSLKIRLDLLKNQQKSDPFLVNLRHFVETKSLPSGQRYRNIIKRQKKC